MHMSPRLTLQTTGMNVVVPANGDFLLGPERNNWPSNGLVRYTLRWANCVRRRLKAPDPDVVEPDECVGSHGPSTDVHRDR